MIKHLAFVMDGNRRWAQREGFMPWQGHREGANSLKRVVDFCIEQKIPYASFYTFSLENFKRPEDEKNYLFDLLITQTESALPLFTEKGARVRFIGDREKFPVHVKLACERIEQATAAHTTINLNFLFCYGARQEIVSGVRAVVKAIKEDRITQEQISEELFAQMLWTKDIPEPELIIRTGGVRRLSNFLLYQAAYSEFYFLDCLWPDITAEHVQAALDSFLECRRNFGI